MFLGSFKKYNKTIKYLYGIEQFRKWKKFTKMSSSTMLSTTRVIYWYMIRFYYCLVHHRLNLMIFFQDYLYDRLIWLHDRLYLIVYICVVKSKRFFQDSLVHDFFV